MAIIKVTNTGQGVNKDLTPEELQEGMWSDVTNMRFDNGYVQRFKALGQIFDTTPFIPYYVTPYTTATKRYWISAGTARVIADDGTTRTEITPGSPFTGAVDDRWSATTLGGVLVMTNGKDLPQFWNGDTATDLAPLTNWDTNERCSSIHTLKNYLVALDITKTSARFPYMVKWSHAAVPGSLPDSWDETDVTRDAGEVDLAETTDLIVDALPLGDSLIIYKERSAYLMRFIGQPFIFQFQRLPGEYGMLFKGCGAVTPLGHVVLTSGDVMLSDGNGFKSIADGLVRRHIFQNINTENFKRAFVCSNPQRNEVLVCYPEGVSTFCNKAAVWNWVTGTWGFRDLSGVYFGATGLIALDIPNTWASDTGVWEFDTTTWNEDEYAPNESRLILSTATKLVGFDIGGSDDGVVALSGLAERRGMTFEDPYSNKLIRAIYPRVDAATGAPLQVQVGSSMYADGAVSWSPPVTFQVGRDIKVDTFAQGRFLAVRFSGSFPWRMRSFDVDVVPAGAY
jgi:hypothetical protein